MVNGISALVDSFTACNPDNGRETARRYLFVYGTLKRGFHWHNKFLSEACFLSEAITCHPHALVVGDSGVPYMLQDVDGGKQVKGEVFVIDDEILVGLDEYEGVRGFKYHLHTRWTKLELSFVLSMHVGVKRLLYTCAN